VTTQQSGFTLIEILVATVIVGILAAIAIPAYQDYVIRTQVSEGMDLSTAPQLAIAEYYDDDRNFPANNAAAGLVSAGSIQGEYVSRVDVGNAAGKIQVTYGTRAHGVIQNHALILSAITHADTVGWACYSDDIDNKYLPNKCRR
jgi:type IV pilus assembly protein PilA